MASDDSGNYQISRRDYFAGNALRGILSNDAIGNNIKLEDDTIYVCREAAKIADAMIKALDNNDQAF